MLLSTLTLSKRLVPVVPVVPPEPVEPPSLSDSWPSSDPGPTLESHNTYFWAVMDSGTAYADELIAAGPLSDHTKEQTNLSIEFWHEGLATAHSFAAPLNEYARNFWSVIGDVHDGVYVDSGSTPELTARRLLDTWADYSTAMQVTKPDYVDLRQWSDDNSIVIAPNFFNN